MMCEKMNEVEIYTEGACRGNPGPGGWGGWMIAGGHEKELFGGDADTTNNRMELMAVIEALRALKRPCKVVLHTDSQYVQKAPLHPLSDNRGDIPHIVLFLCLTVGISIYHNLRGGAVVLNPRNNFHHLCPV